MKYILREWNLFCTSVMFLTRIPLHPTEFYEEYLNESARYFPLTGILIGLFSGSVYLGASFFFSTSVSVILSMCFSVFITGAFHEDGFTDFCDGFGGGYGDREKIIQIMKDSRIGAFGTVGISLLLILKWQILSELPKDKILLYLVSAHALSRAILLYFLFTDEYASENGKSKPMAQKISWKGLVFGTAVSTVPLLFFRNEKVFLCMVPMILFKFLYSAYLRKRLGGYTGDCLGAAQQMTEVILYMSFIQILLI